MVDAILTAASLRANRLPENLSKRLVWIWVVDIAYVGFVRLQEHLTALLPAIFVVMAVVGYRQWLKDRERRNLDGAKDCHSWCGVFRQIRFGGALARHYQTLWVPEYLREFVDQQQRVPRSEEKLLIAQTQRARELDACSRGESISFAIRRH